jgi:hypothetical protein
MNLRVALCSVRTTNSKKRKETQNHKTKYKTTTHPPELRAWHQALEFASTFSLSSPGGNFVKWSSGKGVAVAMWALSMDATALTSSGARLLRSWIPMTFRVVSSYMTSMTMILYPVLQWQAKAVTDGQDSVHCELMAK